MKTIAKALLTVVLLTPLSGHAIEFDADGFMWCGTYGVYPTETKALEKLCHTTESLDTWHDECLDESDRKSDRIAELESQLLVQSRRLNIMARLAKKITRKRK